MSAGTRAGVKPPNRKAIIIRRKKKRGRLIQRWSKRSRKKVDTREARMRRIKEDGGKKKKREDLNKSLR